MNRILPVLAIAVLAAACDGDPTGDPPRREMLRLDLVGGDAQVGEAGEELREPLVVRAVDERGHGIRDELLSWVVTAGGGHVFAGTSRTDRHGMAREWWTLGPSLDPGANRLEVRTVDPSSGEKRTWAVFSATGLPVPPIIRLVLEPAYRKILIDEPLGFTVSAWDEDGPRSDADVTWSFSDPSVVREAEEGPVGAAVGSTRVIGTADLARDTADLDVVGILPDPFEYATGAPNDAPPAAAEAAVLENASATLAANFHRTWGSLDGADFYRFVGRSRTDFESCSTPPERVFTMTLTVTAPPTGPLTATYYQDGVNPWESYTMTAGETWSWSTTYEGLSCDPANDRSFLFGFTFGPEGELPPDTDYEVRVDFTAVPPGAD